jgi:hypothetical protein
MLHTTKTSDHCEIPTISSVRPCRVMARDVSSSSNERARSLYFRGKISNIQVRRIKTVQVMSIFPLDLNVFKKRKLLSLSLRRSGVTEGSYLMKFCDFYQDTRLVEANLTTMHYRQLKFTNNVVKVRRVINLSIDDFGK